VGEWKKMSDQIVIGANLNKDIRRSEWTRRLLWQQQDLFEAIAAKCGMQAPHPPA